MVRGYPICFAAVVLTWWLASAVPGQTPSSPAGGLTSLTNPEVSFQALDVHHVQLQRAQVTAVVVDNAALQLPDLPQHKAGYNGLASLTYRGSKTGLAAGNPFVGSYAGLNFEHIHDGTTAGLVEKFEPRQFPMQLRRIDEFTVELYQPPTDNWQLESCGRYTLLSDGVLEYSFECIPRANNYRRQFIGLFWASYINSPADMAIYFRGQSKLAAKGTAGDWIRATTPEHGVLSTHPPQAASLPAIDADFPLKLVNHPSTWNYTEPWYYGVRSGMALVYIFRPHDGLWFAQSPSGGGDGNPAWDFQWFIRDPQLDQAYGFQMQLAYVPFESREQIATLARQQVAAMNASGNRP